MFVKNVFRNKIKKINKKHNDQIKEMLLKPEFILFNSSENLYLPEEKKEEEIIHSNCQNYCDLLRKIRDIPEMFIDHIKKYNFAKPSDPCDDSLKFYVEKKTKNLKKVLTKLDIDENVNNIKMISARIKNSFIVQEVTESALKAFDSNSCFMFFEFKDEINYKIIDKIKCASIVILSDKKQALELKKRNYKPFSNNLFVKT
jgi:hypothetical protein